MPVRVRAVLQRSRFRAASVYLRSALVNSRRWYRTKLVGHSVRQFAMGDFLHPRVQLAARHNECMPCALLWSILAALSNRPFHLPTVRHRRLDMNAHYAIEAI